MPAWLVIAQKDLRLLVRDRPALFWVIAFPLAFALFFGSVMKPDADSEIETIRVVVVDDAADDTPEESIERLVKFLEQAGLQVTREGMDSARDKVRRGDAVAFARAVEDGSTELGIDPSRRSEAALLQAVLSALSPTGAAAGAVTVTNVARSGMARSGYEVVFPAMVLWGLLGCAAAFAISMVGERSSGALLRLRAAPITRVSILAGKAAACGTACAADAALLSLLGWGLLGVQITAVGKFVVVVAAIVVCFSGLTMVLSVLGTSEQAVAGAGWATLILMAMLGGAMVPLALFPDWLLSLSNFSPVRWGILALEGATWRDFRWPELLQPLLVLCGVGAAGFIGGVGILTVQREV